MGARASLIDTASFGATVCSGELPSGRAHHSATALPDASILIIGGQIGQGSGTLTADVYKLKTNTKQWIKVQVTPGPAPSARGYHSATLVGTKVVVVGGWDGYTRNDVWELDVNSQTWWPVECTGKLPARCGHSVVVVGSRLFAIGGRRLAQTGTEHLMDVWALDLDTKEWKEVVATGTRPPALAWSVCMRVGSSIWVFGHDDKGGYDWETVYILDTLTDTWKSQPCFGDCPRPANRYKCAVVKRSLWALEVGSVLKRAYVLSPDTSLWSEESFVGLPPFPHAGQTCTAIASELWFFGGSLREGKYESFVSSASVVDVAPKVLKPLAPLNVGAPLPAGPGAASALFRSPDRGLPPAGLPTLPPEVPAPRFGHTAVAIEHRLIVIGGWVHGAGLTNEVWTFDVETRLWALASTCGSAPTPRHKHAAVAVNKDIYVVGGYDAKGPRNDVFRLNTTSLVWTAVNVKGTSAPPPTYGHTVAVNGRKLFVFGGFAENQETNCVWMLDLTHSTWQLLNAFGAIPRPVSGHVAFVINARMFVFGGRAPAHPVNTINIFDTQTGEWTEGLGCGELPPCVSSPVGCLLGSRFWLFGGLVEGRPSDQVAVLDTSSGVWTHVRPRASHGAVRPRHAHAGGAFPGGRVVCFGGHDGDGPLGDVVELLTDTPESVRRPAPPRPARKAPKRPALAAPARHRSESARAARMCSVRIEALTRVSQDLPRTELRAVRAGRDWALLEWAPLPGLSYRLQVREAAGYRTLHEGAGARHRAAGLKPDRDYVFRLTPYRGAEAGCAPAAIQVRTLGEDDPEPEEDGEDGVGGYGPGSDAEDS
eukprot:tig00020538_g10367.t1